MTGLAAGGASTGIAMHAPSFIREESKKRTSGSEQEVASRLRHARRRGRLLAL